MANAETLKFISEGEGTSKEKAQSKGYASGYDVTLGYGAYDPSGNYPDVSKMTMAQLDSFQTGMLKHPANKLNSSAAGKYQIIRTTRRSLQKRMGLSDNTVFTPAVQDAMANELLKDAKVKQYQNGSISTSQYQNNIAGIWDSVPQTSGTTLTQQTLPGISQSEIQGAVVADSANSGVGPTPPAMSAAEQAISEGVAPSVGPQGPPQVGPAPLTGPAGSLLFPDDASRTHDANHPDAASPTPPQQSQSASTIAEIVQFNPRPNVFKEFSTMTYNVSLYMLDNDQYAKLMATSEKNVDKFMLFMQSGGAPAVGTGTTHGAIRSKYFENDYYIDDIQFKSAISGTSTMGAINTFEVNFKVSEPAGITFIENLTAMVHNEARQKNYAVQQYLMVVRFYGYDEDGVQVKGHELESVTQNLSDPVAVGEKFIPFIFTGITFKLQNSIVEYSCKAVCPQTKFARDAINGKFLAQATLGGTTLADVFEGPQGLTEALNQYAKSIVKNGKYKIANKYHVIFEPGVGFESMKILQSGSQYLPTTGMTFDKDKTEMRFLNNKLKVNMDTKQIAVLPGTSIIKIIDVMMQTSEYISSQYKKFADPSVGPSNKIKGISEKDFKWFRITTETKQIGWDDSRNNFAYDITYVIKVYEFVSESEYVNQVPTECFSIHKEYDYWFTGNNTEVLDFSQDYNYLWYSAISNTKSEIGEKRKEYENNYSNKTVTRAIEFSGGTEQMGTNESTEVSSNIGANLYSPADQAMVKINIVGDPDLFAQSEVFYSPSQIMYSPYKRAPFLKDGSVNYDISEIYFTINFNTVVDYDVNTGLADVIPDNLGNNPVTGQPGVAKYSLVYRANIITTELAKGKFSQQIEGTMKQIQPHCKTGLPKFKPERREDPNKRLTTSGLSLPNGNMKIPDIYSGEVTNSQAVETFPGQGTSSDESLVQSQSQSGDTEVPFLDDYVNSDNNNYSDPNSQEAKQDPNKNTVDEFKDYVDADVELELDENGRNILERGYKTGARFTQGVWTDVSGFFSGNANEDDR